MVHSAWVCDTGGYNSTADEDSSVLGSYALSTVTSLTFWGECSASETLVAICCWQCNVAEGL